MTNQANRATAARVLFISAFAMFLAAALIWFGVIPMAEDLRKLVPAALAAAGVADLIIAVFFAKGGGEGGRI
jgi:hypothetical protein